MIKLKDLLNEETPGLWANIRAKKARGEKPAHGNSDAHKDAVKAGKEINKEATLTEKKYYVTYNKGRGQGKDLEKEFDQKTFKTTNKPKVFNSYNDAKKYAEKMEKIFRNSIGGGTAYWVSDEKMNPINEANLQDIEKKLKGLPNGVKVSGGGYGPFVKTHSNTFTNPRTKKMYHSAALASHIGNFKDFKIHESELKGYLAADVVDDIIKSIGSKFVSGEIKNAPNRNYIYLKLTDMKFGSGVVKMLKSQFGIDAKVDKTFGNIPTVSFASKKVVSEKKSDYEVYHKSYTSAIEAAREYAEKKGYEINNDDAFTKIGMGPRKPSEGKTNRFSIELSKDGKVQRKKLQIQVYGMRNSYELNAYIQ